MRVDALAARTHRRGADHPSPERRAPGRTARSQSPRLVRAAHPEPRGHERGLTELVDAAADVALSGEPRRLDRPQVGIEDVEAVRAEKAHQKPAARGPP